MKNEIIEDIEELLKIIQSDKKFQEIFVDVCPIEKAIADLKSSKDCSYNIENLSFVIKCPMKNIKPDLGRLSIIVNNHVLLIENEQTIAIKKYNLDIVIYGYKEKQPYQYCWHLDRHISNGKDRFAHPIFHFQAAGKLVDISLTSSDIIYIGTPRIPHPPMDIILVIHFILANFYDKKVYHFISALLSNNTYRDIIKRAQKRMIDPYLNGLHDPTAHPDYNINTIYPTYI